MVKLEIEVKKFVKNNKKEKMFFVCKLKFRHTVWLIAASVISVGFLSFIIACTPTSPPEPPITFTVTRITYDSHDDVQCRVNDRGDVVWMREIGDGGEIYCFTNGYEVVDKLSYNPYKAGNPQINNRGDVAWWQYDGFDEESDSEIYCYQIEEKMTIRFTDNSFLDFHPKLNNSGDMVWYGDGGEFPGFDNEVFLYVYSMGSVEQVTGTVSEGTLEQMMSFSYHDWCPQINDTMDLVWQATVMREDMPSHEICSRFLESEQTYITEVWDDFTTCTLVQINDHCDVVWQSTPITGIVPGQPGEDPDSEIFLYSLDQACAQHVGEDARKNDHVSLKGLNPAIKTGGSIQITDNDWHDSNPQINNNGLVVWYSYYTNDWLDINANSEDQLPDSEIYLYDKEKGSIVQITNNDYDDRLPFVSDLDYVVWMGYDGNDQEIYLYDYASGSTTQLTDNLYNDEMPYISSNFVVWQGKVDGQYEIFRAAIKK